MSQYPSPYPPQSPQQFGYAPTMDDPRLPARRAGIFMIVLGILMLLMGGCMGAVGVALPSLMGQMPPEQIKVFTDIEARFHISPGTLLLGFGIFMFVFGLVYIVMGFVVRGGGLGSVITSIVLTVLTVLYLVLNLITSLFEGAGGAGGACVSVLALAMFGLLLVWLIQAARASTRIRGMQSQYQQQYMQYQQMMQQYGQQAGYGYGYPPPPAPPASPPAQDPNQRPPAQ